MPVYKLKAIIAESDDDVFRIIEILDNQNFQDLHEALIKYFEIKKNKAASFFTANDKWQKTQEISLGYPGTVDNSIDGKKTTLQSYLNKKTKKLIYYNEGTPALNYFIEISEIIDEAIRSKYPVCVKSVGSIALIGSMLDDAFADNARVESDNGDDDDDTEKNSQDSGGSFDNDNDSSVESYDEE